MIETMNKAVKSFFLGLLLIGIVLAPVCRSKKAPPAPKLVPTTDTTATVPNVPTVVTTTETRVSNPPDFVQPQPQPSVTVETLPNDVEELNRVAEQRGYLQDAFYSYDESTLTPDAQSALTSSATWLKKNAQYNLLIEGHCDERGSTEYNSALGDKRASAVKNALTSAGVSASRIKTISYGKEKPFCSESNEACWQQNRRGHLVLQK